MSLLLRSIGASINAWALVQPEAAAEKVLALFCQPREGRHKPHHEAYLASFEKMLIPTEHGDMAVFRRPGSGPSVLLCHGWESNAFRWRKVLRQLKEEDLDLYMMEAPAHGASDGSAFTALWYAEAMRDVIASLKPQGMVAHSVGGFAMCYAAHNQWLESIQHAIVMAPPDTLELITDNYFNLLGYSDRVRVYYDQLIEERFGQPISFFNASDFAHALNIPGILIHDEGDSINKHFEGVAVAENWEGGSLVTTSGLGHSLQGEEVYETISRELSLLKG